MKFQQLTDSTSNELKEIFSSYCLSFPEDERRSEKQFFKAFHNPKNKVLSISFEGKNIGYLIVWSLSQNTTYIEHFEVFPEYRNMKLGSKILKHFGEQYPKLILESEPRDLSEISSRRINFYERNGFNIVDETHIQPAYDETKNAMLLWVLSNFETDKVTEIIDEICLEVYERTL